MVAKRKRAPGGGRKTIGPTAKSSNFSTRIRPETRGALEAEAAAAGLTVSRMAEKLLELGIEVRRERSHESPTAALVDLIAKLADKSVLAALTGKRFEWNTEPFVCDALRAAISLLLDHLRPQGESSIKEHFSRPDGTGVHEVYREVLSSPDAWARHVFLDLWGDLTSIGPYRASTKADFEVEFSQYSYDLDRARRALGFREKKS